MGELDGLTVLVTGASRGLGQAIAVAAGREGAWVAVHGRSRPDAAERTLAAVHAAGGDGGVFLCDVRDRDAVAALVRAVESARGPLDVLVNNAGVAADGPAALLGAREWRDVLDVNLSGAFYGCQAVLPGMMARRAGAIVNVASVAGLFASGGQANYAASKGGLLALTRTLAVEAAPFGVRVNAVVPGVLTTGLAARLDRRVVEERRARVPLGRLGEGDEVAQAVVFLASRRASYVVGQALVVDGGLTA
jgi:3-oxoacyl-[acyl-carrier protein] reductase